MKKGYLKICIFEFFAFLILIINNFVPSILSDKKNIIFYLLLLFIFRIILGFEKDRHRRSFDVIIEILIYVVIFYILYYLAGIFFTFSKTNNYLSLNGIYNFILPIIINSIILEILRYNVLCKSEGNKFLFVLTTLLFSFLYSFNIFTNIASKEAFDIFKIFALSVLPNMSINILNSYLCIKSGYKPSIFFRLIYILVPYIIPIFPNPTLYLRSLIDFIVPLVFLYKIYEFVNKYEYKEIDRDYYKKRISLFFIPIIMMFIVVYFVSGYFKYYAIAIVSGSMTDTFSRGDVVIVEQINSDYDRIDIGNIIAFKYNKSIVVHRIVRKAQSEDSLYFYTKGDANLEEDNFKISEKDIVGIVKFKINKIGYPTVWFNEL